MPLLDEGQLSAAAAQLWWSNFAFAVLRLWLLIMAGDVELNPGPVTAGRSGGWLGVSDGVAAQLLALLWGGVASRLGAMAIGQGTTIGAACSWLGLPCHESAGEQH